jgi:hypothetical protein
VQCDLEQYESALQSFHQGRLHIEKLIQAKPEIPDYHSVLGDICNDQGLALARLNRLTEAVDSYRQAVREQRLALDKVPQSLLFKRLLREHYEKLAGVLESLGQTAEAASVREKQQQLRIPR